MLFCFVGYLGVRRLPFGAVEGIGIGIFIGFSCDYCVHIVQIFYHSIHAAKQIPRQLIKMEAIANIVCHHAGPSLYGAALTTCGSCLPLLFCRMGVLSQFGELIIMVTSTSMMLAFTFLLPMLTILAENPCR